MAACEATAATQAVVVNIRASQDLARPRRRRDECYHPADEKDPTLDFRSPPAGPRIGLLTVGETARILGVSPSTLRLWENVGLISPVRSNGRYRLYIYMMAGTLEIWLDELECHALHEGDSFWFESTVGHRWYNPSREETVLLWISTPPTF